MRGLLLAFFFCLLSIKLPGGLCSDRIDFVSSFYVADPDEKAVSPLAIRGPCGRNSLGYLHIAPPMGFMTSDEIRPPLDRKFLISLPEAKLHQADSFKEHPFEAPIVMPDKRPAEVLTVATHPEVASPLSSLAPIQKNEILANLLKNQHEDLSIPAEPVPENKHALSESLDGYLNLSVPQSQMLVPEALLYFFQNQGNQNPSAVLPFDVPLSGLNNNNTTTNFSSATYIVE